MDNPLYYFILFSILVFAASPIICFILPAGVLVNSGRNKKLEGLRGLLAPTVFFHHALITFFLYEHGQWKSPDSAFYEKLGPGAVMIFFFMTGYLFWEQAKLSSHSFSFSDFMLRRIRRLAPAYYFSVAIIVFLVFCYSSFELKVSAYQLLGTLVPWALFGLPLGKFPDINAFPKTVLIDAWVVWTLRFEWLFYLTFGFMRKFSTFKKYLIFLALVVIGKHLLDRPFFHEIFPADTIGYRIIDLWKDFFYFILIGFNFGVLTSFLNVEKYIKCLSHPIATAGGVICLGIFLFVDKVPAYNELSSCLLFVFFATSVLNQSSKHLFHWKGFQALGHISYSVYLFHGIGLFVGFRWINQFTEVKSMTPNTFWLLTLLIGFVVLIASALSYRYIEYPWIKKKD